MEVRLAFFLLIIATISDGANILAVFPHIGKSHYFMFQPFVNKLAERGHQVTVITHFPPAKPAKNVSYISLEGTTEEVAFNSYPMDLVESIGNFKVLASVYGLFDMGQIACDTGLSHPPVQELIRSKKHFDLVIVEYFNTDCFAVLSHIFSAPLVGIFPSAMMPWHNDRFGNPDNPSYIVNHFLQLPSEMTFYQRLTNTITTFGTKLIYRVVFNAYADSFIKKHLGPGYPPVNEIVKNSSLFLVNSHFSIFQPRPLVPNIVEIGGFHVKGAGKLPSDLKNFLDNSPNGVIFFSLGSTVRGSTMSENKRKAILGALERIPMDVLMKWEDDEMPGKPDNVFIGKWFPQNEVLAHPKVKLFITHSGLMGTEEAVYHGKPMVMMPLFGDQPLNAASCAEKGVGVIIDFNTVTEEKLYTAVKTVLDNKSYTENAKLLAAIFKDRPVSVMENALYWVEYVLKYKGAHHLKSAAVKLPWYSEYLLDILLFFVVVLSVSIYIFKIILAVCCWCCCRRKQEKVKKS